MVDLLHKLIQIKSMNRFSMYLKTAIVSKESLAFKHKALLFLYSVIWELLPNPSGNMQKECVCGVLDSGH